ncbi:MAG: hypothetical protein PHU58_07040 [Prevotella sp.]|nr:hypothetical protein [Prevotella sp.]
MTDKQNFRDFDSIKTPLIQVPFHGEPVLVQVRELTQAQIMACGGGNMSLIETFQDKIRLKKKPTLKEIVAYAEIQTELCKRALLKPTYAEVFEVCAKGVDIEKNLEELLEIERMIASMPKGPARSALERETDGLRVWIDLLLPDDFLAGVVTYALGISKSDIKDVTEDALYTAAVLAKIGNDNPADHLKGRFTDFMQDDINIRAALIYAERQKDKNHGH